MHHKNVFYALLSRMQNIQRWSKSNATRSENVAEHSLQVAMFAHCLGLLRNHVFIDKPKIDENKLATMALYHDAPEVLTEDVNSLIKYSDPRLLDLCRKMEGIACDMLMNSLPEELKPHFDELLHQHDGELHKFVKAADLLSAYAKSLSELRANNTEFAGAKQKLDKALQPYRDELPEVNYFMERMMPAFQLTIDELMDGAYLEPAQQESLF
ncbi:5'-deoxynucleotidase [Neiella marina]|uniref:5'-deoxynucleotidase n=1 Tax=Neiella holothuriorum TaxID=2870530 RepID=A0ABS7EJD0_9GAMM|nr:5'-deoxynucleotidase [Neiella holothuriorum]MBW8191767.1 5'-deoxynucleotidase [Neiella holothuriorum]